MKRTKPQPEASAYTDPTGATGPTVLAPFPTPEAADGDDGDVLRLAYLRELPDIGATRDDVLAELAVMAGNIALLTDVLDAHYAARIALWKVGRAMRPPITQRELGQASGVSDVAIAKKLRESAAVI